jgi:hypothetical protein
MLLGGLLGLTNGESGRRPNNQVIDTPIPLKIKFKRLTKPDHIKPPTPA